MRVFPPTERKHVWRSALAYFALELWLMIGLYLAITH